MQILLRKNKTIQNINYEHILASGIGNAQIGKPITKTFTYCTDASHLHLNCQDSHYHHHICKYEECSSHYHMWTNHQSRSGLQTCSTLVVHQTHLRNHRHRHNTTLLGHIGDLGTCTNRIYLFIYFIFTFYLFICLSI